ncbi:MAG TPA: hypothetical protein VF456_28720 [Vicinamibacterales bacterium]
MTKRLRSITTAQVECEYTTRPGVRNVRTSRHCAWTIAMIVTVGCMQPLRRHAPATSSRQRADRNGINGCTGRRRANRRSHAHMKSGDRKVASA